MKHILVVGDSFTYGDELSDQTTAWPSLLGIKLRETDKEIAVHNIAKPGASNDRMIRTLMDSLEEYGNIDAVIIGWTSWGRSEFADVCGYYDIWPGYSGKMFNADGMTWRSDLVEYVSRYHNVEHYVCKFYQQLVLVNSYLTSRGIKFIMLNTLENDYYKKLLYGYDAKYEPYINLANYLGYKHSGMIEWAEGCPKGPAGHFLEAGHEIVAEKVYEHIGNLGWLPRRSS